MSEILLFKKGNANKFMAYPGRHFQLAIGSAESATALADVAAEPIETCSAVLAGLREAVIDLSFAPFSLVSIETKYGNL